ncbi:MAG: phosphoglucosamine mutase [Flavobacteriales bacterium]|nr:phosphoglucosamine mutase [Flavobacteriales bacterium]
MTLIKSISGIRGTIGGQPNEGLTPLDIVKFTSAFGSWIKKRNNNEKCKIVIGRDARISGEMVQHLVVGTLQGLGIDVLDLDLSTTPTVEVAVPMEKAHAGIILTASHNPKQWNALKLLNEKGEFISAKDGEEVLEMAENSSFSYAEVDDLGAYKKDDTYLQKHIDAVLNLPLVDVDLIKSANFKVAIDCVNSTGGIFLPALLKALGVNNVLELYCTPNGVFPHNPEPLPENLTEISAQIKAQKADVGFVVDPDVDRLAIVCENGEMFGEEYTLVAIADYVIKNTPGNTVSNLSSTRALRDVTEQNGNTYFASAVGEVNVVEMMKAQNAIIGGEGNGGIIYPEIHYGRDALVGIALFLTHLAKSKMSCSALRASYPNYFISKNKIELTPQINVDEILGKMEEKYKNENINNIDGVKIDFPTEWVHLRKSNTEPIIRIYAESTSIENADALANKIITDIKEMI